MLTELSISPQAPVEMPNFTRWRVRPCSPTALPMRSSCWAMFWLAATISLNSTRDAAERAFAVARQADREVAGAHGLHGAEEFAEVGGFWAPFRRAAAGQWRTLAGRRNGVDAHVQNPSAAAHLRDEGVRRSQGTFPTASHSPPQPEHNARAAKGYVESVTNQSASGPIQFRSGRRRDRQPLDLVLLDQASRPGPTSWPARRRPRGTRPRPCWAWPSRPPAARR